MHNKGSNHDSPRNPKNTKIPPPANRTPLTRVQKAEAASSEGGSLRKGKILTDERLSARSLAMGGAGDLWGVLFPSSYLFLLFSFFFFPKTKNIGTPSLLSYHLNALSFLNLATLRTQRGPGLPGPHNTLPQQIQYNNTGSCKNLNAGAMCAGTHKGCPKEQPPPQAAVASARCGARSGRANLALGKPMNARNLPSVVS